MAFRLFALLLVMFGTGKAFAQAACYQFSGASDQGGAPFVATVNISRIPPSEPAGVVPGFVYSAGFNGSAFLFPADDASLEDVVTVTSGSTTLTFQVFSISILYNSYGDGVTRFQLGGRNFSGISPAGNVSISLSGQGNLLPNGLVPALPQISKVWTGSVSASLGNVSLGGQISSVSSCPTLPPDLGCAQTATVDATKISIVPNPTGEFHIERGLPDKVVLAPGVNLWGAPIPPFGMNIHVNSDAVSYTGTNPRNVSYDFVQVLNTWSGHSVYSDYQGSEDEWFAVSRDSKGTHQPPFVDSLPYANIFPYYPRYILPRFGAASMWDSPEVSADLLDPSKRRLVEMHYTKEFTSYFGCHTPEDEALPRTDPNRFIRTLAIVKWRVNYSGKVEFSCLGVAYCQPTFTPDSDNGVRVESKEFFTGIPLAEPPTVSLPTAGQETTYLWRKP